MNNEENKREEMETKTEDEVGMNITVEEKKEVTAAFNKWILSTLCILISIVIGIIIGLEIIELESSENETVLDSEQEASTEVMIPEVMIPEGIVSGLAVYPNENWELGRGLYIASDTIATVYVSFDIIENHPDTAFLTFHTYTMDAVTGNMVETHRVFAMEKKNNKWVDMEAKIMVSYESEKYKMTDIKITAIDLSKEEQNQFFGSYARDSIELTRIAISSTSPYDIENKTGDL